MEPVAPALMSSTCVVPASVPSLFHSSAPCVPLVALKNKVPFTLARLAGRELPDPTKMSFTSAVPASVPSVFQSSIPSKGSVAVKKTRLPTVTV